MTASLLIQIGEMLEARASSAASHTAGLSYSEVRLLSPLLDAQGQGLTRAQLAELSHLSPSAVSRALKPLEKSGYVISARDSRDARNSRAKLTPSGKERLNHALESLDDLWQSLDLETAGLSEDMAQDLLDHLSAPRPTRFSPRAAPRTPNRGLPIPSRPGIRTGIKIGA